MADDIVERLRNDGGHPDLAHPLCIEAADALEAQQAEIKRLRAERDAERALADQLAYALDDLRALADQLAYALNDFIEYGDHGPLRTAKESLAIHHEARRG